MTFIAWHPQPLSLPAGPWKRLYVLWIINVVVCVCSPPLSLPLSSLTQPAISRRVPPHEPGPDQGLFLLKGDFPSIAACLGGVGGTIADALKIKNKLNLTN